MHCNYFIAVYLDVKYNCIVLIELHYIPEVYIYSAYSFIRKKEIVMLNRRNKPYLEEQRIISNARNFIICRSCFWCASHLNNMNRGFAICPSCKDSKVESMPISIEETYKFDYDGSRGVTLEFGRIR